MLKKTRSILMGLTFACAIQSAVASDRPSAYDEPAFKDLYQQARKAGESEVVYYAVSRPEEQEILAETWAKHFPDVKLTIVNKESPKLTTQIEAEKAAGYVKADVVTITQPAAALAWKDQDRLQSYVPTSIRDLGPNYADPDGAFYASGVYLLPAAYSTASIKAVGDAPHSISDFLKPKWKGKIVLADPTSAGNTRVALIALLEAGKIDWPFLEKLAQQDVLFVPGNSEVVRLLASGERSVTPIVSSHNVLSAKSKGQAVELYGVAEGTLLTAQPTAILKGGPHPNAAKLLLEVLLSAEGQASFSRAGRYWPTNSQAASNPDIPSLATFNAFEQQPVNEANQGQTEKDFLSRFAKVFGRE